MKGFASVAITLAAVALAGCTVHKTEAPGLTGPSGLALSLSVSASPESINQDGASQSRITITAIGPNGEPKAALPLRIDMAVGGVAQDFGTLSARSVVTDTTGKAFTVYTAPPSPVGGLTGTCAGLPGTCVTIVATPSDSGSGTFDTATPATGTIRLVPPGVILPPAGSPTASFTMTPTPVNQGVAVTFDASASIAGTGATTITSYAWSFGDGSSGSGKTVSHTFSAAGTFSVTLTVTNDRGLSASTSQAVAVVGAAAPKADFVVSPSAPQVNQSAVFNADISTAGTGHTLTTFNWNFGDGATASGLVVSHTFASVGTFNVVLSVMDDLGQKATKSTAVTVSASAGSGAPTAVFTFSPAAPGINQDVFFNASSSTAAAGHKITAYAWDFGDGSTGTGVTPSHAYGRTGSFTVTLTVTDDTNQTAVTTNTVAVANTSSQIVADFTFSPTDPAVGATVFFDATPSSSPSPPPLDYTWDFGDGNTCSNAGVGCGAGTPQKPQHQYAAPAHTWVVRLTIRDAAGRTATVTKNVTTK